MDVSLAGVGTRDERGRRELVGLGTRVVGVDVVEVEIDFGIDLSGRDGTGTREGAVGMDGGVGLS